MRPVRTGSAPHHIALGQAVCVLHSATVTLWPYNEMPAGFVLTGYGLDPADEQALTEKIWSWLVAGNADADEFVDAEQEGWDLTGDQLYAAFEAAREVRIEQQAQWTSEQTGTNLDRAFAELNEAGILARQNFTCCGTCGTAEIGGEMDGSRHWRGYVFFHQQDTETLVDSGYAYLNYGLFPPADFDQEAYSQLSEADKEAAYLADLEAVIADDAVPRLEKHGLDVEWDGNIRTRILLRNAQWYVPLDA